MRIKLKFAFGRILKTEELLDHVILDDEPIKNQNGVTLKRTRTNVFQIAYDNEIVTVNLTVIRGRNDRSAYPLGFKGIDQDYFSIIHSGQGDALDFEEDRLGKIVMAHRADPLTNKQKEIGASAIFSVLDALVPAETDNLRRF